MLQTRTRLVTFRVSDDEYEELRLASEAQRARSVSEFVRSSVAWIVSNCDRPLGEILLTTAKTAKQSARTGPASPGQPEPDPTNMEHATREEEVASETLIAVRDLTRKVDLLSHVIQDIADAHARDSAEDASTGRCR